MHKAHRLAKARVGIVGAGPCGLALALMLRKLGVHDFQVFEAKSRAEAVGGHPAAHYVNGRSLEVFASLGGLGTAIRAQCEDLRKFRYYRYCRRVGGTDFQVTDQLDDENMRRLGSVSGEEPVHMPQNRLCELMVQEMERGEEKERLRFGARVEKMEIRDDGVGSPS
jgi:2-polyprenyl-6-methoxyphenol hydroxylase-like FAD-dependent oxidoreductase